MQPVENILIIDDDPINTMVLKNTLGEDYQLCFSTAQELDLSILQQHSIDLVILGVLITEGDGFTVLETLKKDPVTYSIPVIVISSSVSFKDEARGLQLGAVDYITKPFNPLVIKARIKNHLAIKKKNDLLEKLAAVDGLTELPNRRYLDEQMHLVLQQAQAQHSSFAVMLVEVDYFKKYNEHYGYMQGDECLFKVARALEYEAKQWGVTIGRFDGTRFAMVLSHVDVTKLKGLAQALQAAVAELAVPHQTSPICAHVSVSIGVVHVNEHAGHTLEKLVATADSALAKAQAQQLPLFIAALEQNSGMLS